jgi:hypothetical protein
MTLTQRRRAKTRKQLVAEMTDALDRHLATLPPREAERRLNAALRVAAKAKSSRRHGAALQHA